MLIFRDARLAGAQRTFLCHWVVNNPDNFTDPVARNVLCARWEAPSRKINISERALRGKFFRNFFREYGKNPEGSSSKENFLFFCEFYCSFLHVDFFETHDSQERREHFCHWVVNNPDNFTDPVARNVLCARWEAPSRKINISERALRGKFFRNFFREYGKNPEGSSSKENFYFFASSTAPPSCWFFRDARLAGSAENIFLPLGRE